MKNETILRLHPHFFMEKERAVAEWGGLTATIFRYDSGVDAIRIKNKRGEIIVLPYQGQQIWQLRFDNKDLHMKSIFDEPVPTRDYLSTYGGFFLHCGVTAVGVPSSADTHPLHGELPNAPYRNAFLTCGQDDGGRFMTIGGQYLHRVAMNHNYSADPVIKIYEDSAMLEVSMVVTNLRKVPMEVMYLGHINFRPVDNAELVYSAPIENVEINVNVPKHIKSSVPIEKLVAFLQELKADPAKHHKIAPEAVYDPEVVMSIKYLADSEGFAHSLQIHPDGYANYVRHRPDQMEYALRWIARNPDLDAMGLVLPANTGNGGYVAEKAAGNIKTVAAGEQMRFDMQMGLLDPEAVAKIHIATSCP